MITIHCTSCKKALEVDEKTLSDRDVTVLRCPSCQTTLTVDKRKVTRPSVTGPVVTVAAEEHKALLNAPPEDELRAAGVAGEYITIVTALYDHAETYLRNAFQIDNRAGRLEEIHAQGREALAGMQLACPQPVTDKHVRAAVATPELPDLDLGVHGLARFLTAAGSIVVAARQLWLNVTAPHGYTPVVEWQSKTATAVTDAYAAASKRSPRVEEEWFRLQEAIGDYDDLVKRYRSEHAAIENKIAAQKKTLESLQKKKEEEADRVRRAVLSAEKSGMGALQAGGCAGAIVAVILGGSVAAAAGGGAGFIAFVVTIVLFLWVAYQIGYGKNTTERGLAESARAEANMFLRSGELDMAELLRSLKAHEAIAPDSVAPVIGPTWSLLTIDEFDSGEAPRATGPQRLQVKRVPEGQVPIPDVPAALFAGAAKSAPAQAQASAGATRSVGFVPAASHQGPVVAAAGTMVVGMAIPAQEAFLPEVPATEELPVRDRRKLVIIGVVAAVVIAFGGWWISTSVFGLKPRMEKALAAGQIFAPAGSSVFDLYMQELAKKPASPVLAEMKPKIQAVLGPVADESFARWYKESDDTVNWEEMERSNQFLATMDPGMPIHEMRRLYAIGQQSIDRRDYAKAISSYEETLQRDASWALALNGIGKVYMIDTAPMHNERLGISYYERATKVDPSFTWAPKNLGDYYLRKSEYRKAEYYLLRALSSSPERPSILRALGYICRKTKRRSEAIAYYEKSLQFEKDPERIASAAKAVVDLRDGN